MLADAKYQATLQTIKSEENLATDRITAAQSQKKAANDKLSKLQDDIANAESNWEKISATERLAKARPEIEAVIDDANQEIADNMANITALFAEKQIAEYDLYGAHSKAVEKDQKAKASDKLDKSSDLPPSTKMDIASDRLSKIGLYMGGGAVQNLAQKTANATEKMAKTLDRYLPRLATQNATQNWSD
jgi:chromosome segregation ATPase